MTTRIGTPFVADFSPGLAIHSPPFEKCSQSADEAA
jgi:hypothetical protein